uniref:Transcriptional regulator, AbrB family n=1 Tax=Chlorobium chlorochromatii (strain CaD3) TaxID=340177 RepID=Q3ARN5_CHLCH
MPITTMTSKGQVTIPKEIRDLLELHSGDRLEFTFEKWGRLVVSPVKKNVDDLFGRLFDPTRKAFSTEAINDALRQKFQHDEQ